MTLGTIYRMYNKDNELLYVGQSISVLERMKSHKQSKEWWVEIARIELEHCDRRELNGMERKAIIEENPKYNINHRRVSYFGTTPVLDWSQEEETIENLKDSPVIFDKYHRNRFKRFK